MPDTAAETPKLIALTFEQLQAILAEERKAADERMVEMIREIRKPTAEEQRKLDEDRDRRLKIAEQRVENARQEMAAKERRESLCPHVKGKGESAVFGQKHSDGLVHPICVRCQKAFPPYKPRAEDL